MDQYLTFVGGSSLSKFRRRELAARIGVEDVNALSVHFVCLHGNRGKEILTDDQREALNRLLTYSDPVPDNDWEYSEEKAHIFFVYPRQGISPWSSKATSIAQVCGLDNVVKRIERGTVVKIISDKDFDYDLAASVLHDRMTQAMSTTLPDLDVMFREGTPAPLQTIELHAEDSTPQEALEAANKRLGLALDASEIAYLIDAYASLGRSPTDVELFMFSQVNSEHCRHKQFNASWTIDGEEKPYSLFGMIRATHAHQPAWTVSAYNDNAAVLEGAKGSFLAPSRFTDVWTQTQEQGHYLAKCETHNFRR